MSDNKKDDQTRVIILEKRLARLEKMINEELNNTNDIENDKQLSLVDRYRRNK